MLFGNMLNLDRGIFLPLEERPVSIRPYFFICIFMRPSHIAFNRAIRHCTNQSAQLSFKPEYKHTVKFWRAMMTPVALFSQMLACLLGLDILIYRGSNSDIPSEGSAVDISHSRFGENSSYQIVAEFVAAVMRIVMIIKMKLPFMIKDYGVGVTGDSIIALTRISKEKYRGLSVSKAAMIYTILGITCSSVVSEAVYLSAADNWRADDSSRISTLGKTLEGLGYGSVPEIDLMGDKEVMDPQSHGPWCSGRVR